MKKYLLFIAVMALMASDADAETLYRLGDCVQTIRGDAVGGATITVYTANTTTKAELHSGPHTAFSTVTNPATTDRFGRYSFYLAPGVYDIRISGTNITTYTVEDVRVFADAWTDYVGGKGIMQLFLTAEPDTIDTIGQFWFDEADSTLKFYDGTTWHALW